MKKKRGLNIFTAPNIFPRLYIRQNKLRAQKKKKALAIPKNRARHVNNVHRRDIERVIVEKNTRCKKKKNPYASDTRRHSLTTRNFSHSFDYISAKTGSLFPYRVECSPPARSTTSTLARR